MSRQAANKSFTKSLYDSCNINKKFQETTGPFNWIMDSVYESNDNCYLDQAPFMHTNFFSIPLEKIDLESELRNQTRPLSRCPSQKYDPTKPKTCSQCKNCDNGLPCGCPHCQDSKNNNRLNNCKNRGLVPEYTRIQKPCNLSGININRFNPVCEDAQSQKNIHENSYIGSNTRLQIKDAFQQSQDTVVLKNIKPLLSFCVNPYNMSNE
jgi:hypothetical protein